MFLARRMKHAALTAALALAVTVGVSACTATEPAPEPDIRDITIALAQPPRSIDPALASPPAVVWTAYEPLIYRDNDGSLVPALATEWKYLDDENKEFEITLRSGVTFSDGDELTPAAVKASLERFVAIPDNRDARYAGDIVSIEETGDNTLVITYGTPNPTAAVSLTQDYKFGLIISPTGLADTDALTSESHGAGQYVLNSAETVDGSTYVYEPNPTYWNPDAVKFSKVTWTVMPDTASQLAALQSGQADIAWNTTADNVETAVAAGFTYSGVAGTVQQIMLQGRDSAPLDDDLVREAFSHSIDRAAIVEAIYSGLAVPASSNIIAPSVGAYDVEDIEFDPELSKSLLADAGYPDGITVQMLVSGGWDPNYVLASALQQQLAEGGIAVELITVGAGLSDFITPLFDMTYPVAQFGLSAGADTYFQLTANAYSPGTLGNVLGSADPELDALLAEAAVSTGDEYAEIMTEAVKRFDALNWLIPIAVTNAHYLLDPDLVNVPTASVQQQLSPFSPVASDSWAFVASTD